MQKMTLIFDNNRLEPEDKKQNEELEKLRGKTKSLLTSLWGHDEITGWQYEVLLKWGDLEDA